MNEREQLLAQARREYPTLREAIEAVEQWDRLVGAAAPPAGEPEKPKIVSPPSPKAAPPKTSPSADRHYRARLKSGLIRHGKHWEKQEIRVANNLLAGGLTPGEVAQRLGRTRKSITGAIDRGLLEEGTYVPNPAQRAGGYITAINRGRKLKDYNKAQRVLDGIIGKEANQEPKLCEACSCRTESTWSGDANKILCYSCAVAKHDCRGPREDEIDRVLNGEGVSAGP